MVCYMTTFAMCRLLLEQHRPRSCMGLTSTNVDSLNQNWWRGLDLHWDSVEHFRPFYPEKHIKVQTPNTLQMTSRSSGTHFGTFPELPDRALDKSFHPSGLLWLLSGEMVRSTPYWLGGPSRPAWTFGVQYPQGPFPLPYLSCCVTT
jgi:hypothetical protein